jgi:hypothetical protein
MKIEMPVDRKWALQTSIFWDRFNAKCAHDENRYSLAETYGKRADYYTKELNLLLKAEKGRSK